MFRILRFCGGRPTFSRPCKALTYQAVKLFSAHELDWQPEVGYASRDEMIQQRHKFDDILKVAASQLSNKTPAKTLVQLL